jgi:Na+/alanine symporter
MVKKAVLKTFEAIAASTILIILIVLINNAYVKKISEKDQSIISFLQDSLIILDENQTLRQSSVLFNNTEIEEKIESMSNSTLDVYVTICNLTSCIGNSIETENTVTYVISGNEGFNPMEVKVYAKKR